MSTVERSATTVFTLIIGLLTVFWVWLEYLAWSDSRYRKS